VRRLLLVAVAGALLAAGCGDDEEAATQARVYFLQEGKVWPVDREIEASDDMTTALVRELADGPTEQEQELMGLTTEVPESQDEQLSDAGLAQYVFTMTQFSLDEPVEVDGQSYARADFEDQTPSVLVESPLPFEEVETPLRVTGTANTFEANFQYELLDSEGNVVDENFVTATSGTGTRGTFDFTTDAVDDLATLVVFESSAEDGSRIHEVEIPLSPAP
jgi:germination protein M